MLTTFKQSHFVNTTLTIAIPVAFQNLISTALNMADVVMISGLGEASIAAVGLVNQFVFFYMVTCFGFASAGSTFYAQFYGKRDFKSIRAVLSVVLVAITAIGFLFTSLSVLFPEEIMGLLSPEAEVVQAGIPYLRIVAWTLNITGVSICYNGLLRSTGEPKAPLRVSVISVFTNILFNYLLINGNFGFPKMGVAGAAVGTLIARVLEVVLLTWTVKTTPNLSGKIVATIRKVPKPLVTQFWAIALPIVLMETLWALAQLLFSVFYAAIGKQASAAVQLSNTIQNVFFIIVNSLAASTAIVIGHTIGTGDIKTTFRYSKWFLQITLAVGILSSAVLAFLPDLLLGIYSNLDPALHQTARNLLVIRGVFITFRFINGVLIGGVLRGGGDSKVPFIVEMLTMWVFAVPFAFVGVHLLKWPVEWIFIIVSLEEVFKMVFLMPRFVAKKWITDVTELSDSLES